MDWLGYYLPTHCVVDPIIGLAKPMRHWWHSHVPRLKWPVQASVFVAHFVHHTLAFIVWASLILHVAIPAIGAGLNIHQISQATRKWPLETCLSTGDFCPKPVIWIDVSCPAKRPIFWSFRWQRKLDQGD